MGFFSMVYSQSYVRYKYWKWYISDSPTGCSLFKLICLFMSGKNRQCRPKHDRILLLFDCQVNQTWYKKYGIHTTVVGKLIKKTL